MNKAKIINRLHALGLNGQEALEVLHAIREEVLTHVTHRVWRFRELSADKLKSPYAAMTNLMGELRDLRYDEDPVVKDHMRIAYIAHPIGGDVEANLADLRRIVRVVNHRFPDVVPFVPYYADCVSLHDHVQADRDRGIRNHTFLLKSGIVDELWLTGPTLSAGMRAERMMADHLGIPILDKIGQL